MSQDTARVEVPCETEGCNSILVLDGWKSTKKFCRLCLSDHASQRYRKNNIAKHWSTKKIREIIPQIEEEL